MQVAGRPDHELDEHRRPARLVHALAFTFAVPWVRTLAFVVGFLAQAALAWALLVR